MTQPEQPSAENPNVVVLVSPELIEQLGEWSEPVRVRVVETPATYPGWEMRAMTPVKGLDPVNGQTSDGFHTFDELYDHRRALTAALIATGKFPAWRSRAHHPDDSECFPGYFIVGIELPTGTITYHYADQYWDDFQWGTDDLDHAPKWDGASPELSITRLLQFARERG